MKKLLFVVLLAGLGYGMYLYLAADSENDDFVKETKLLMIQAMSRPDVQFQPRFETLQTRFHVKDGKGLVVEFTPPTASVHGTYERSLDFKAFRFPLHYQVNEQVELSYYKQQVDRVKVDIDAAEKQETSRVENALKNAK